MATAAQPITALLTMEEYLSTAYHPDVDFVDGALEERNVGDARHGKLQMQLGFWFVSHQVEWNISVISELRTRVSSTRVRLPDVAVIQDDEDESKRVRTTPFLLAIEILSPDDRINRVMVRLKEFIAMGVPNVWLIDPVERVAYTLSGKGLSLVESTRVEVPDSPIYLDLTELFTTLDRKLTTAAPRRDESTLP